MLRAAGNVLALIGFLAIVASDDEVLISGPSGLKVHCSLRGARITVYRSVGNGTSTGKIRVSFAELRELNGSGDPVSGESVAKGRRIYSAFDEQDFTVSGPADVVLPNSNQVNASCLTVTAGLLNLSKDTVFAAMVCAVKDNGTLRLGDENSTLAAGQLKFTVSVRNWDWTSEGMYLQLTIDMKIPRGQTIREEGESGQGKRLQPKKYRFGGGAAVDFSTQVKLDDSSWASMPPNYPMYENKGDENHITIRIPRFNTSCEYDPSIEPGYSSESYSSRGSYVLSPSIVFLMAVLGLRRL